MYYTEDMYYTENMCFNDLVSWRQGLSMGDEWEEMLRRR